MEGKQGVACRPFARNMHVKIKRSEITIEFSISYLALSVPRTEPPRWLSPYWDTEVAAPEHVCGAATIVIKPACRHREL